MMRFWSVFLLCALCYNGIGQTRIPVNRSYTEKYYFLDTNRFLQNGPFQISFDSLKKLHQSVVAAGDMEFSGELILLSDRRSFYDGKVSVDSLEKSLRDLVSFAHTNSLPYLEADALKFLGDFYFDYRK